MWNEIISLKTHHWITRKNVLARAELTKFNKSASLANKSFVGFVEFCNISISLIGAAAK